MKESDRKGEILLRIKWLLKSADSKSNDKYYDYSKDNTNPIEIQNSNYSQKLTNVTMNSTVGQSNVGDLWIGTMEFATEITAESKFLDDVNAEASISYDAGRALNYQSKVLTVLAK